MIISLKKYNSVQTIIKKIDNKEIQVEGDFKFRI